MRFKNIQKVPFAPETKRYLRSVDESEKNRLFGFKAYLSAGAKKRRWLNQKHLLLTQKKLQASSTVADFCMICELPFVSHYFSNHFLTGSL